MTGHDDCMELLLERHSDTTALVWVAGREEQLRWSYARLQAERKAAAQRLQAAGLQCGDCVVVQSGNYPQCFALLLAAFALGVGLLPLHADFAEGLVVKLLARWRPKLVIREASLGLPAWQHALPCPLWWLQPEHEAWLQPAATATLSTAPTEISHRFALLFHSSGSSGEPKGVQYTAPALNAFLHHLQRLYAAFPDLPGAAKLPSPRVNMLPWTHWGGLSFCLQALLEGRALHLLHANDSRDHLHLLQRTHAQLVLLIPGLLQELLALAPQEQPLPDVRHCLAMGESISQPQLLALQARLGGRVYNAYGMSECLTGIHNCHDDPRMPLGSVGRLQFGEVRLLGADGHESTEEGELCVRNGTTTPCYTDPLLNAARYRDGWFHTGDRMRRDGDGYFFHVGRIDGLCVINGRNVYPREVEEVVMAHPDVCLAVATPLRLQDGRQRLALAVQLHSPGAMNAATLLDFYLQHGAVFATPAWVEFWPTIPRNTGDKLDRARIANVLQGNYDRLQQREALHG